MALPDCQGEANLGSRAFYTSCEISNAHRHVELLRSERGKLILFNLGLPRSHYLTSVPIPWHSERAEHAWGASLQDSRREMEFSSYFIVVIFLPILPMLAFRYSSKKPFLGPHHLPIPSAFTHACVLYAQSMFRFPGPLLGKENTLEKYSSWLQGSHCLKRKTDT